MSHVSGMVFAETSIRCILVIRKENTELSSLVVEREIISTDQPKITGVRTGRYTYGGGEPKEEEIGGRRSRRIY